MLQVLAIPDTVVIAGVRTPEKAQDLQKLTETHGDRLHIVKLDLADIGTLQVRSTYDSNQLETICNDRFADDARTVPNNELQGNGQYRFFTVSAFARRLLKWWRSCNTTVWTC